MNSEYKKMLKTVNKEASKAVKARKRCKNFYEIVFNFYDNLDNILKESKYIYLNEASYLFSRLEISLKNVDSGLKIEYDFEKKENEDEYIIGIKSIFIKLSDEYSFKNNVPKDLIIKSSDRFDLFINL